VKASTGYSLGHPDRSPDLKKETLRLLARHRIYPKKRLGQNFLIDQSVFEAMMNYADLSKDDVVLEVGTGLGFLTRLLSSRCRRVVTVEVDTRLSSILRDQLKCLDNVELVEGDVLTADIPIFDKVVSTPPYSISSPLLFWLFNRSFKLAVLAFQEEFAKRLAAQVGNKDYSRLTVAAYYRADAELLDSVPRSSFYPSPDVDSIVVRLKPKPPPFKVKDEKLFFQLVQTAFTQRNKKLRNAIVPFLTGRRRMSKEQAQEMADKLTFHDKRVRQLAPEDFGALTNEILDKTSILP
jgi:16S rRNA (adenine1518-N6/adenine1519-N6)-dimethyltransferase